MARDEAWEADKRRYPKRPFLKEQSIWAVAIYRWGRRIERRRRGPLRWLHDRAYWLAFRVVETLTGIMLPRTTDIGPGLRIHHFGNIFIGKNAKIGANCTLRQGVMIAQKVEDGPEPVVEDDVDFGASAVVLGGVRIGRGARIGAMSVVLTDVPAGATAVGNPARIIERNTTARPAAETNAEQAAETKAEQPATGDDRDTQAVIGTNGRPHPA